MLLLLFVAPEKEAETTGRKEREEGEEEVLKILNYWTDVISCQ